MITRETDYALRALVFLSETDKGKILSTDVLARKLDIPYQFLRRILPKLTAAGILKSTKGKGGGICLAKNAAKITMLDAISAIDPVIPALNDCTIDPKCCSRSGKCMVHRELGIIQDILHRELSAITFAALAKKNKQQKRKK